MTQLRLALFTLAVMAVGLGLFSLNSAPASVMAEGSEAEFTVNQTTLESNYPRGMTFTIDASSDQGEIARATLYIELRPGTKERENAEFDAELGVWVARPYSVRGGLPPWVDFHYSWMLTDVAGHIFETEPQYGIYEDNTREWWSIDTEDITLYWFGEMPELGEQVAEAMAEMRPLFAEGWGRNISYKPLAILFPPGDIWNEYVEGGVNPRAAGFTNHGIGYTVQRIGNLREADRHEELRTECGGYWYGDRENTVEEWRQQDMVHTIIHEVTHLYQSDFRVSGPQFWSEGEADFFAGLYGWHNRYAEGRILNWAAEGLDLPTLQGGGPSGGSTESADGCHAFGYSLGEHFIGWVVENFGGLPVHADIIAAMPGNGMEGALEEVTGMSFVDLENEYRAYLGYEPLQLLPTPTPFVIPTPPAFTFPTAPPPNSGG